MKLFCKDNHWKIVDKQLLLTDKNGKHLQEQATRMEAVIEARVRMQIYNDICDLKLTENRKAIVKAGVDNVALTVQAICADTALGYSDGNN